MKNIKIGCKKGDRKKCRFCLLKSIDLMIHSRCGKLTYYSCRTCQAKKHIAWYRRGNQKKQQEYNKNYVRKSKLQ